VERILRDFRASTTGLLWGGYGEIYDQHISTPNAEWRCAEIEQITEILCN
jgi:hypothetical protein